MSWQPLLYDTWHSTLRIHSSSSITICHNNPAADAVHETLGDITSFLSSYLMITHKDSKQHYLTYESSLGRSTVSFLSPGRTSIVVAREEHIQIHRIPQVRDIRFQQNTADLRSTPASKARYSCYRSIQYHDITTAVH